MSQNWPISQRIDCLCDGEVMEVFKESANIIHYNVMVLLPNGSRTLLTRVPMSSMFGGIGDYFQSRLRGTNEEDKFEPDDSDQNYNTTIGDRVIISFLGGHIQRPIIVGYLPHPQMSIEYEGHTKLKPQGVLNYLGMAFTVDKTGQFQIIHRGAPKVSKIKGGVLGALSGALSSLSSLSNLSKNAAKPNPALEYPDAEVITMQEFLDKGQWTVRDSEGQQILMDRTSGIIKITNAGKSTKTDANKVRGLDTKGEYINMSFEDGLIDIHARDIIEIFSGDVINVTAKGDRNEKIIGNDNLTVSGDKDEKIAGNLTWKIGGDYVHSLKGAYDFKVGGDYAFTLAGNIDSKVKGNIQETIGGNVEKTIAGEMKYTIAKDVSYSIAGNAKEEVVGTYNLNALKGFELKELIGSVSVKNGKVAIKGVSGELLDILSNIVQSIMTMTVGTALGPSSPPINAAEFVQHKLKIDTMKG